MNYLNTTNIETVDHLSFLNLVIMLLEINLHYIEIHVCLTRCYYTIMYIGNIAYDSSRMFNQMHQRTWVTM